MIGGVIKYFRLDWDEVVWIRSYANVNMLLANVPSYETEDDGKDKKRKFTDDDETQSFFSVFK